MNRNEAKAEIKNHLEDVLSERGIDTRRPFRCLNPDHEDKHPSMGFHKQSQRAHCFKCGANYDTLDVMGLDYGYTDKDGLDGSRFNEMFNEACRRFHIDVDGQETITPSGKDRTDTKPENKVQRSDYPKTDEDAAKVENRQKTIKDAQESIEDPEAVAYLAKRGLSLETAKQYGLGYLPEFKTNEAKPWKVLIIPTGDGTSATYTARNLYNKDNGDRVRNRGAAELFNMAALEGDREAVYIVEGEIDALSVIEAGGAAVGLDSTSNIGRFITALEDMGGSNGKTLLLSLDNDHAGMKAEQELSEKIKALGFGIETKRVNIAGDFKDPNEALTHDREGFIAAVREQRRLISAEEREEYLQSSAAAHLTAFYDGVSRSVNTPAIPTGFYYLDNALDGGLYEGLYTIPAITSLGKTTFSLQMADQIAEQQGKDVLYITMEMAETELIAKSLSRHTLLEARKKGLNPRKAKTVRGITDGKRYEGYDDEEQALISAAYEAYNAYAGHVYIKQGIGDITAADIREAVARHIAFTGNTPVVFVDYVQILAPMDKRATDKQNIDASVLELKRISRDFKTPVVIVSAINRSNYEDEINFSALKESGALEYTSDVVMGLQYQGVRGVKGNKKADIKKWSEARIKDNPRHVDLVMLKNRNGEPGKHLYFDYYKQFNHFNEQAEPKIRDDEALEWDDGI